MLITALRNRIGSKTDDCDTTCIIHYWLELAPLSSRHDLESYIYVQNKCIEMIIICYKIIVTDC